ncbi:substrate-binding periplasmic protein [Thalassotalea marina]|uniref:ABC transporter substrate-binding protein n=1 Tax=Thalassotalea marina TaxID=1673741 RepID=A0A919EL37_9GAMM|nr:transporter substrate-binding domain-containing protein [Thalassotalea marina]GHF94075.1 ABC transporter substrate-binding protein [Thalassotalea marina]
MKKVLAILFMMISLITYGQEKLKIVTEQYPPFQTVLENNQVSGSATSLVKALMAQADIPYDIFVYPWPRALKELENTPSVLLFSMMRLPAREAKYQWIAPLCSVTTSFYRLADRSDIKIASLIDAKSYRIGVELAQGKNDFLVSHGFIDNLVQASTNHQLRKMMQFNRIDLILISDDYAQSLPPEEKSVITKIFTIDDLTRTLYLVGHLNMEQMLKTKLIHAYQTLKTNNAFECDK